MRLFAMLRDKAGAPELALELREGATAADAVAGLVERIPSLGESARRVALAVNREYASKQTVLHEGDELALIPPVSGG